ncbi:ATP-grasp domain-containing protein [Bacillus thuringiensis]|uniref:ATP-grasp domain-containing protein n=1 Tax=Bacillus thuringiensis subsp. higo TaxID=132266 RepID=A0A9X6LVS8_BACUH|nr:ATP-grasp domain-containing protein [Bacillus thuringiensis]MED2785255.1 ATP-grasp domain-containing protein [Bacillus thuringiensis]MED2807226.1 ATP-grasp domain-containing protein [Bacillus thuringiensis]MED2825589.1 ATP-grasp domain-containing protein [Bacillus thuringiensis]MED2831693.1 ATP-grasp domain-containing protein [Bacillus thuringiensis]MED2847665.1 ATP-grasp domain-containing protein [Bacillus thuringiensis]
MGKVKLLTFDTQSATQLGLIRNVGERKIPIALCYHSGKGINHKSKYVSEKIEVPNWDINREEWVQSLIEIGKKSPFQYMIISCSDYINLLLVSYYDDLKKYFYFPFNNPEIVGMFINKDEFYNKMNELEINIPRTYFFKSLNEVEAFFKAAVYPLIIKPNQMFDSLFIEKFGSKILILNSIKDYLENINAIKLVYEHIIIQEMLEGETWSVYGYFKDEFLSHTVYVKDYLDAGGTTVVGHSIKKDELLSQATSILQKIDYEGFAELEFMYNHKTDTYCILEVNARPVQWCRLVKYVYRSVESIPLEILNNIYSNVESNASTITRNVFIYQEMGLLELVKQKELTFKEMIGYLFNKDAISMFYDTNDLKPSLLYRLNWFKCIVKWLILKK